MAKNAVVELTVREDFSLAYIFISPPEGGGRNITKEEIMSVISTSVVKMPVEDALIDKIVGSGMYKQNITIAKKVPAVDGENGRIEYMFAQTNELAPSHSEDRNDVVNLKDLGLVKNTYADTLIAKITLPTEGTPGMDVRGIAIKNVPGKPVKFVVGKGTALSEDGTEIRAAVDGNLKWEKSHFVVEQVLVIGGDVGAATGDIDFIGDIMIKGMVSENFIVKSQKNIQIQGTVSGASIYAEGNIEIKLGAVNSTIDAKGEAKIGFCESSKVTTGRDLHSASFVACEVYCGGELFAVNGKGAVVGGKLICINGMTVKNLGSETYTKTRVTLGNGAVLAEKKLDLENEMLKLQERIKQLVKVETLLNEQRKLAPLTKDREVTLAQSTREKFAAHIKIKNMRKEIQQIEDAMALAQDLSITVKGYVYPGVRVRIGTEKITVERDNVRCKIYVDDSGSIAFRPL